MTIARTPAAAGDVRTPCTVAALVHHRTPPMPAPLLSIRALSKRYDDTPVFHDVTLAMEAGEFVALLGESGVGKSTLLNCIAGLDRADSGSVQVAGADLATLPEDGLARLRREQLGFVFQAFHVLPHLTVAENVSLPLRLLHRHDDAARGGDAAGRRGPAGTGRRGCRPSCPAASCSAWPSPARWCTHRADPRRRAHRQPRPRAPPQLVLDVLRARGAGHRVRPACW